MQPSTCIRVAALWLVLSRCASSVEAFANSSSNFLQEYPSELLEEKAKYEDILDDAMGMMTSELTPSHFRKYTTIGNNSPIISTTLDQEFKDVITRKYGFKKAAFCDKVTADITDVYSKGLCNVITQTIKDFWSLQLEKKKCLTAINAVHEDKERVKQSQNSKHSNSRSSDRSSDRSSERSSERSSYGSSDRSSERSSDRSSESSSDISSYGSNDRNSDISSYGSSDISSYGSSDISSFYRSSDISSYYGSNDRSSDRSSYGSSYASSDGSSDGSSSFSYSFYKVFRATTSNKRPNFIKIKSGTYYFNKIANVSWSVANKTCVAMGMKLLQIDTASEYIAIIGMLTTQRVVAGSGIWFGATDKKSESVFQYQKDLTPGAINMTGLYTQWGIGEPDNAECNTGITKADCAMIVYQKDPPASGMYDMDCKQRALFICEFTDFCTKMINY